MVGWPNCGIGHVDDLGIHAGLHGIENIAAGQVDGGGGLPGQIDAGLAGGDHGVDDPLHVAAGQQMAFHFRLADLQAGLRGLDSADDDRRARSPSASAFRTVRRS